MNIQCVPYKRKLRTARPTGNILSRGSREVVSRTTTKIPALILWLENICSSSKRNRKVKWEGNSPDVTENAQSGYRWPLNTPRIFEGIPAKRAEVRQPKLKQPHSLSRFVKHWPCGSPLLNKFQHARFCWHGWMRVFADEPIPALRISSLSYVCFNNKYSLISSVHYWL
jgi:hypothetical protein